MRNCDLEGAVLTGVTLADAKLQGTRLHDADLFDVRINEETEFGDRCAYEIEAFRFTPGAIRARLTEAISTAEPLYRRANATHPDEFPIRMIVMATMEIRYR